MALTPDYANRIIHSDASITDMVAFHLALRDIEDGSDAILYPVIHTYKAVQLGGGAIFPAVKFINSWTLQFPAGNWVVKGGNLDCTINPVAGAYVERTQAGAYAVTSIGAGGATPDDIALAVMTKLVAEGYTLPNIATAVGSRVVEGAYTHDEVLRIMAAMLAGKVSGATTGTEIFRDLADTKDRVTVTTDQVGNRLAVTRDAT